MRANVFVLSCAKTAFHTQSVIVLTRLDGIANRDVQKELSVIKIESKI